MCMLCVIQAWRAFANQWCSTVTVNYTFCKRATSFYKWGSRTFSNLMGTPKLYFVIHVQIYVLLPPMKINPHSPALYVLSSWEHGSLCLFLFFSKELDMTSTFVSKAALIAQRKMEQKPRPERREKKKTPVKGEPKTVPDEPNEDLEAEKKVKRSASDKLSAEITLIIYCANDSCPSYFSCALWTESCRPKESHSWR